MPSAANTGSVIASRRGTTPAPLPGRRSAAGGDDRAQREVEGAHVRVWKYVANTRMKNRQIDAGEESPPETAVRPRWH